MRANIIGACLGWLLIFGIYYFGYHDSFELSAQTATIGTVGSIVIALLIYPLIGQRPRW